MQSRAQPQDCKSAAFWLPALIATVFVAFVDRLMNDGDVFWHVKAGEWMLDHRMVPVTDPFSFTFAGMPWHAHEWLSEVIFAAAWRMAGWSGVILVCALAVALAMGLLNAWLARRMGPLGAGVASLLVFTCLEQSLLARPHLLAIPLIVLWSRVLLEAAGAGRAPQAGWLLLLVLWANLHGSVLFAVGLTGLFALEALLRNPREWRSAVLEWAPFGIGAAVAVLVTPTGLEGALFLVRLTQMESLSSIREWQPIDLKQFQGFHVLVMTGVGLLLRGRVRVPAVRAGLVLLLLIMTMQHQRHQMLLGIVGTMIVCEAYSAQIVRETGEQARRGLARLAAAGVALVAVIRLAVPFAPTEAATMPATALAHVPAYLRSRPVLNGYSAGGYLIARGVRPFIDGRTDLYGDAFIASYSRIEDGDPVEMDRAIARYGIEWTLLPPKSGAAKRLDHMPGWRRVYADAYAAVHVRGGKAFSRPAS